MAGRCIGKLLPTRSLDEAIKIRDWVVANKSPDAAKQLLTLIISCCDWSKKSGLIPENPFEGMSQEVKVPKSSTKSEEAIDPFSPEERDLVIQTFAKAPLDMIFERFVLTVTKLVFVIFLVQIHHGQSLCRFLDPVLLQGRVVVPTEQIRFNLSGQLLCHFPSQWRIGSNR